MRWLVCHPGPSFSVADVFEGWAEALRGLGQDVLTYALDERLRFFDDVMMPDYSVTDDQGHPAVRKAVPRDEAIQMAAEGILSAAFRTWPDVILLISAFFMPPLYLDMFRDRGMRVILLHTESPYQDDEQLDPRRPRRPEPPQRPGQHRRVQGARRPRRVHAPRLPGSHPLPGQPAEKKWDLSFIGTGYPSRVRFFEAMDLDGLAVHLAGPWLDLPEDSPLRDWTMPEDEACVSNDETAGIYRASRCGINVYRRESEQAHAGEGWAVGPREVELAACGTWFTRDPRGEGDELFPMLPAFTSPAEAGEQIRWALAHPAARDRAAAAARQAVTGRTFSTNAKRLLTLLDT